MLTVTRHKGKDGREVGLFDCDHQVWRPSVKDEESCGYLFVGGRAYTADISVVDPNRMMHTDGSTEKPIQPVVHA